jgi:hypothetical protein
MSETGEREAWEDLTTGTEVEAIERHHIQLQRTHFLLFF